MFDQASDYMGGERAFAHVGQCLGIGLELRRRFACLLRPSENHVLAVGSKSHTLSLQGHREIA